MLILYYLQWQEEIFQIKNRKFKKKLPDLYLWPNERVKFRNTVSHAEATASQTKAGMLGTHVLSLHISFTNIKGKTTTITHLIKIHQFR